MQFNMKYLYIFLIAIMFTACGDEIADLTVEEYIEENNLVTTELDEGVHIIIEEEGNDRRPNINSTVTVNYVGKLTNGAQFHSNTNIDLYMSRLIEGWRIGLKEIGEGGSCTLIIPPSAGYGSNATSSIPANSVLVFDMDLITVK